MILIIVIVLGSISFYVLSRPHNTMYVELLAGFIFTFSASFLLFILVLSPIRYMEANSFIQEFKSVQQTVTRARENSNIELAAFQLKIAEMNQKLARLQYWKGTVFGTFLPNNLNNLEPLE